MNQRKRIAAGLICAVLALAVLASSALIIHEAGHDCLGEDCPICHMIAMSGRMLRLIGAAVLVLLFLLAAPDTRAVWRASRGQAQSAARTPVSQKTRLNN